MLTGFCTELSGAGWGRSKCGWSLVLPLVVCLTSLCRSPLTMHPGALDGSGLGRATETRKMVGEKVWKRGGGCRRG